jgi:phosphonopyruvate decarboxylase
MIHTENFIYGLEKAGIRFITGVPDSLLKDVCACITAKFGSERHIVATNEGSAVGLAIGHYLATARPALVYLQNSGVGNALNPVTSLADTQVYAIPLVLMIGWRGELMEGEAEAQDEPQHVKQGQVTLSQLDLLDIPYQILDADTSEIETILQHAVTDALARSGPVALVVRKNTFTRFSLEKSLQKGLELSREEAIQQVLDLLPADAAVVSTTGMASREVFELRKQVGAGHQRDFLTVGGMGHAGQIAAGIALACPHRTVVCIDGDGAVLMHAGALAVSADCPNLLHIVLNNEAHDSVGGQPTKGNVLRFDRIADAFGYRYTDFAIGRDDLREKLARMLNLGGSALLEVRCKQGARKDLGRPDRHPVQNKTDFMKFLRGGNAYENGIDG